MTDTSYPMAILAREFNLDYGLVLNCAEEVRRDCGHVKVTKHLSEAYSRLGAEFVYDMFVSGIKSALNKYGTRHARY